MLKSDLILNIHLVYGQLCVLSGLNDSEIISLNIILIQNLYTHFSFVLRLYLKLTFKHNLSKFSVFTFGSQRCQVKQTPTKALWTETDIFQKTRFISRCYILYPVHFIRINIYTTSISFKNLCWQNITDCSLQIYVHTYLKKSVTRSSPFK